MMKTQAHHEIEWMKQLERDVERSLVVQGINCCASIRWDSISDCCPAAPGFVVGAHEAVAVSVYCRVEAADDDAFEKLNSEEVILNLHSCLKDRLPPDWLSRVIYARPLKSGAAPKELDPPQFGKARFDRFELFKKGNLVKSRDLQTTVHPLVQVFLADVHRAIASHVSSDVWESARRSLEESWRHRLRYRVERDAMISAEDYELLWTSVNYLFDKLGLPSPDSQDRKNGGFSTRSQVF